jgi:adenine-specific DNA-methyltransferase
MQKLELTWIGKGQEPAVEPRILLHDASRDYGDPNATNMLIHGDNLLALKALEQEFAGRVKCVYIDPPYNTGAAFEHYDDNLEHSTWLRLMRSRLEILRNLLQPDGFFACHIDDSEGHYLKVLLDEVFGRDNYQTTLYIRVRYPEKTLKQDMRYHKEIEQVHIYRREYGAVPNFDTEVVGFDKFRYYIEDDGNSETITLGGKRVDIFQKGHFTIEERDGSEFGLKEIWASGTILDGNSSGRFFRDYLTGRVEADGLGVLYKVWGIGDDRFDYRYFTGPQRKTATKGKYFQGVPTDKLAADEVTKRVAINNFYDLAGSFGNCRLEGGVEFRSGKKPEALLELILRHFSSPGDLVLDSFLGSGTTAAVAQKMGRRYIGIELGEHCYTHCWPRLKAVVDGDSSGISSVGGWQGGGGFKFYELASSLIAKDENGFEIISEQYDPTMLAAAVAKLCGYRFAPREGNPYIHGVNNVGGFIFVTTQYITAPMLGEIAKNFSDTQSLVICASAFQVGIKNNFPNIKLRKIPQSVLSKCEYGAENYNLNVVELPDFEETEEDFEDAE